MPIQKRQLLELVAKYSADNSAYCLECSSFLKAVDVTENRKHIYTVGQLWSCPCKKTKLWTNSIRNEKNLFEFWDGKRPYPGGGFCNDKFCGTTYEPLKVLKNGVDIPGLKQYADILGCGRHKLAYFFEQEYPEEDTSVLKLATWYKPFRKKISDLM